MPFVQTLRACVQCGDKPGTLYGLEGQGASPQLCKACFNGGRGIVDSIARWARKIHA